MPHLTYSAWRKEVSKILVRHTGLGLNDYPDWQMYDAWEAGDSPKEGALSTLEESDMPSPPSETVALIMAQIEEEE